MVVLAQVDNFKTTIKQLMFNIYETETISTDINDLDDSPGVLKDLEKLPFVKQAIIVIDADEDWKFILNDENTILNWTETRQLLNTLSSCMEHSLGNDELQFMLQERHTRLNVNYVLENYVLE